MDSNGGIHGTLRCTGSPVKAGKQFGPFAALVLLLQRRGIGFHLLPGVRVGGGHLGLGNFLRQRRFIPGQYRVQLPLAEPLVQVFYQPRANLGNTERITHNTADGVGNKRLNPPALFQALADALAHHRRVLGDNLINGRHPEHRVRQRACGGRTTDQQKKK